MLFPERLGWLGSRRLSRAVDSMGRSEGSVNAGSCNRIPEIDATELRLPAVRDQNIAAETEATLAQFTIHDVAGGIERDAHGFFERRTLASLAI